MGEATHPDWLRNCEGQSKGCGLQNKEPEAERRNRWGPGSKRGRETRGLKRKKLRKELGVGRESGRMGFGNPCPGSHEMIQVSWSFISKHLKSEMQFHETCSSIARSAVDWLQDWINIFQIPVKSFAFQFLLKCHSGRNVSKIDSRALQIKHGTCLYLATPLTPPKGMDNA